MYWSKFCIHVWKTAKLTVYYIHLNETLKLTKMCFPLCLPLLHHWNILNSCRLITGISFRMFKYEEKKCKPFNGINTPNKQFHSKQLLKAYCYINTRIKYVQYTTMSKLFIYFRGRRSTYHLVGCVIVHRRLCRRRFP